jgi:phenylacetate-coenzyme A ligase PaaK-like adenylate-forming protein
MDMMIFMLTSAGSSGYPRMVSRPRTTRGTWASSNAAAASPDGGASQHARRSALACGLGLRAMNLEEKDISLQQLKPLPATP